MCSSVLKCYTRNKRFTENFFDTYRELSAWSMHTHNHVVDLSSLARRSFGLPAQIQMENERFLRDRFGLGRS